MLINSSSITLSIIMFVGLAANSFVSANDIIKSPASITRTSDINPIGQEIIKTEILLDGNTSREDLIHTCRFLADEEIALTFESLNIRRSFLGILGKKRIVQAKGKIELPNSIGKEFQVGGLISFRSIKITSSQNTSNDSFAVNTLEVID